jgi:GTPase SAR1 family protein
VNVAALRGRVETLCASAADEAPPGLREQLISVSARLGEPLLVALVGRVNAGKSTIVNALVGQRVAPTDVSECTQVVAAFRYGAPQRIEAHLSSGETVPARLGPDGLLPRELPVPADQVVRLDVWLSNDRLRSMTLLDTPGLGSLDHARSHRTGELLGLDDPSRLALRGAEALVFVLTQTVRADERAALGAFHALADEAGCSAVNAVGILNKADQIGASRREARDQ